MFLDDFDVFMTASEFEAFRDTLPFFPIKLEVKSKPLGYYNQSFGVFDVSSKEHSKIVQVFCLDMFFL